MTRHEGKIIGFGNGFPSDHGTQRYSDDYLAKYLVIAYGASLSSYVYSGARFEGATTQLR